MSLSTRIPILTASPEQELLQLSRTWAHNPHLSKLSGKHRRTGNTDKLWYFTSQCTYVSVEYASHMMVPSAKNIMRYHGLSQFIQMNN